MSLLKKLRPLRPAPADAGWLLLIGSIALALRLVYVVQYTAHPLGRLLWVDEVVYWERGVEILRGKWLPDRPFFQDPLIHYLLAVLIAVVGDGVRELRLALACLGALTPMIACAAGWRILGRAEGIVAGLALAAYGPLVFTDGQLEKEGMAALFAAAGLMVTAWSAGPGRRWWAAVPAGLLWGATTLLRANALLVAPIGAIWWLLAPPLPRSRRLAGAAGFLLGFATAIAPVTLVNLSVSRPREFILMTWQGGAMFYTGNGPDVSGVGEPAFIRRDPHVEASDFAAEAMRRAGRALTPGQVSSFWMGEGLRRWREAPLASLRFLAFKAGLLLNDVEVPDSQSPDWVRLAAAPGLGLAFLSFGWISPWAALGLARRGPRAPSWWFLAAATLAGLGSTAFFLVLGRYRIPWTPGLALLAAAGLVDMVRRLRSRQLGGVLWRVLLVALPVGYLAWRPEVDPEPDRWSYFRLALFVAELQAGDLDAAIDMLDDARAEEPGGPAARAVSSPDLFRDRWAIAVRGRLAEIPPGPGGALERARLGRTIPGAEAAAGRLLDEAAAARGDDPACWRERGGWWLARQAEDPSARRRAAEAYRKAEADPSARITLALLLSDPTLLDGPSPDTERLRLARGVLAMRRARPEGPARGGSP
ncbi:hypothetical protein OJF2_38480 [Aquisphaera giovannonii]|uniref:Glycosyltransferase RgtA/B/C/D-like domain-containing protein n=1 Tax=Aquisphaera giovannonii TaxID=406548 RepID=A0A5B9W5P6_9BACT|nr:glycosyltransferase family 39 protein [Aquisphaera giovannonii]QEH35300.1 hypothetical protein OJF2_38480 [Aquisphaera giovannonii]